MTNTICYVAPSVVASLDEQIDAAQRVVSRPDWVRVDRPTKKTGAVPRDERDFVLQHLLRGGEDRLWVYSLDVLGDSRREILAIFRALHGLEVPLVSEVDRMDGDMKATAYAIALEAALTRAEGRVAKRQALRNPRRRVLKSQKTGGRPKALRPDEVNEALSLRQGGATWPEVAEHFKGKGVKVSLATIRREVAAKRAE